MSSKHCEKKVESICVVSAIGRPLNFRLDTHQIITILVHLYNFSDLYQRLTYGFFQMQPVQKSPWMIQA